MPPRSNKDTNVRRTTRDKDGRIYTAFGEGERERERVTDTLPDGHRLSRCGKGYAEGRQPTRSYDENRVVWKSVWVSVTEQRVSQPWILLSRSRLFDQTYTISPAILLPRVPWIFVDSASERLCRSLLWFFPSDSRRRRLVWLLRGFLCRDWGELEISVG